jgi:7-cyano-7-deazaguanine synthase
LSNSTNSSCLVLVSGGQDSITSLFWAKKKFQNLYAVSFDYAQKHSGELSVAAEITRDIVTEHRVIDISFMKNLVISNLFDGGDDVNSRHSLNSSVPSSFVPYRNMLFLTLAAAWASTLGVHDLVTGVCQTDYSGYADCREVFISSMQKTLNLATDFDRETVIHTPLMHLTKAETFKLARDLGCLETVIEKTMTCYNGDTTMNSFGMGCGNCPACKLRKQGYEEFIRKYGNDGQ